jgi:O-antigen ligase
LRRDDSSAADPGCQQSPNAGKIQSRRRDRSSGRATRGGSQSGLTRMLRSAALAVCLLFIAWLFLSDYRAGNRGSPALWVPFAWMFLAGSRWVSSWLNMSPPLASVDAYAEGSPIDRAVFLSLIFFAVLILLRRKIDWGGIVVQNKWVFLYLLYCLASMAWSDDPLVLFKRWIKDLGNPLMALVILTDRNPYRSAALLLRRLAFVFLPLSLVFIRYLPELGRAYHFDGSMMFTGIGHQKNDLGAMCLISGIYFGWKLVQNRHWAGTPRGRIKLADLLLLPILGWLLYLSNSQTSFSCLLVALCLFLATRTPFVARRPTRLLSLLIVGGLLFAILELTFGIRHAIYAALGRDPTLTNRSELWELLGSLQVNAVVGTGFMSFWMGDRMATVWRQLGSGINQAHNGYLEQYLNLGAIGVAFIAIILVSSLMKIRRQMLFDAPAAMLRLSFVVTAILFNLTEASFYGINTIWLLLLLAALDVSTPRQVKDTRGELAPHQVSTESVTRAITAPRMSYARAIRRSAPKFSVGFCRYRET